MDLEGLYEIVRQGNETTSGNITELKQLVREQNIHLRSKINSVELNLLDEIKELKDHQIKTNGRVAKSEQEIRVIKWIKKHPFIAIGLFFLGVSVSQWVLSVFTIKELLKLVF